MQFKIALALALALLCCPATIAQVPKFTIVTLTREPPGPLAPGTKFKLKVTVRNDGDTIPAGRRFDFIFSSPDAVAIGQPVGTPSLFFGYCPGATPINMVCQCFAAWEKGQTVEIETEVTVGSSARGSLTVTFTVRSGTVSETMAATVQIALAGPDLLPAYISEQLEETQIRGRVRYFGGFSNGPIVKNIGTLPTQGDYKLTAALSAGLNFLGDLSGIATVTKNSVIAPGREVICSEFDRTIGFNELGVQSIVLTVSGGGDVEPSNNIKTFQFEVIREDPDPLNRLGSTSKLAEILGR